MHRHTTYDEPIEKIDESFLIRSIGLGQDGDENGKKLDRVMMMVEGVNDIKLSMTFDKKELDAFIHGLKQASDFVFKAQS